MTARAFYKGFKSLFGSLTAAVGALPLIGTLLPGSAAFYVFPPLGGVYATAAVVLCVITTFLVLYAAPLAFARSAKGRFRTLVCVAALSFGGVLSFAAASTVFLRTLDVPAEDRAVVVSVGFERTAFADATFPDADDWSMLRRRGTSEEEIQRLWTMRSIIAARAMLLASYLVFLLPAVAAGCFAVLFEGLGDPTLP